MLDAHAYVMQVKLCKANTRGVTKILDEPKLDDKAKQDVDIGTPDTHLCL